MHYNLKVEMERVNKTVVTQVEVASAGRARRRRIVTDTFEEALEKLKSNHDEMLAEVAEYYKPPADPASTEAQPPAAPEAAAAGKKAKKTKKAQPKTA